MRGGTFGCQSAEFSGQPFTVVRVDLNDEIGAAGLSRLIGPKDVSEFGRTNDGISGGGPLVDIHFARLNRQT